MLDSCAFSTLGFFLFHHFFTSYCDVNISNIGLKKLFIVQILVPAKPYSSISSNLASKLLASSNHAMCSVPSETYLKYGAEATESNFISELFL